MPHSVVTWDWKDSAPVGKILDAAAAISVRYGRMYHLEPDTGGDFYAVIISDRPITPEAAEEIMGSGE